MAKPTERRLFGKKSFLCALALALKSSSLVACLPWYKHVILKYGWNLSDLFLYNVKKIWVERNTRFSHITGFQHDGRVENSKIQKICTQVFIKYFWGAMYLMGSLTLKLGSLLLFNYEFSLECCFLELKQRHAKRNVVET